MLKFKFDHKSTQQMTKNNDLSENCKCQIYQQKLKHPPHEFVINFFTYLFQMLT